MMLAQPVQVQTAFAKVVGNTQKDRRDYYVDKIGQLINRLESSDLWSHQKQDIRNAQAHITDAAQDCTAISVIPTGGGKTRIFQEETNALATSVTVNKEIVKVTPRIIQLFPTNQLIRQTKKKYAESFSGLVVGEASGRKVDIKPITLMTYDLFEQWAAEGKIKPGDIDMLLMDEAHRGLSDDRQDAIRPFLNTCVVRAFTATPVFDTEKNIYTLLGSKNEVSRFSYDELIAAGHIAPIVNPILKIRINGKLPEDAEERKTLLRELFEQELLNFYLNFQDEKTGQRLFGKPFAGYVNTIERAKDMAEYFDSGIRDAMRVDPSLGERLEKKPRFIAEHVSGDHSTDEQDHLIARIKSGETLGAFNDKLMVEGMDIPNLGATLRSPTSSLVVEVQSGGRAGRINPAWPHDDPRQTSFVVDVCYELNGKIMGKPRFFFEAINAPSIARVVQTPVIRLGAGEKEKKEGNYEVLDSKVAVNHLLKLRDKDPLPTKTSDWVSLNRIYELPGGGRIAIQKTAQEIVDKYDHELLGIQFIGHNGQIIRAQKMQSGNTQPVCLCVEDWPKLELAANVKPPLVLPDKDDKWLSSSDIEEKPGGLRLPIKEATSAIREKYDSEALGIQLIEYNGQWIRIQKMQSGRSQQPICICLEDWPKVELAAGVDSVPELPIKDKHWLAVGDWIAKMDGGITAAEKVMEVLSAQYDLNILGIQTVKYGDESFAVQKMDARPSNRTHPICLWHEDWPRMKKILNTLLDTQKPDGYWTALEFGTEIQKINSAVNAPGPTGSSIIANIREQFKEADIAYYKKVPITKDAIAEYQYNQLPSYAIRVEEAKKIIAAIAAEVGKPEDVWSKEEFGEALGLSPGQAAKIITKIRDESAIIKNYNYLGIPIPDNTIVDFRIPGNPPAIGIKSNIGAKIAAKYKEQFNGKPEDVWSKEEFAEALQITARDAQLILSGFRGSLKRTPEGKTYEYMGVPIAPSDIVSYREQGTKATVQVFGIKIAKGKEIQAVYCKILDSKPDNVWSLQEFALALGAGRDLTRATVQLIEDANPDAVVKYWGDAPVPIMGIKIDAAQEYISSKSAGAAKAPHADAGLKSPRITKKDTAPGGAALKRTGRTRVPSDDKPANDD